MNLLNNDKNAKKSIRFSCLDVFTLFHGSLVQPLAFVLSTDLFLEKLAQSLFSSSEAKF